MKLNKQAKNGIISGIILLGFLLIFYSLDGAANWYEIKSFLKTGDYDKALIYGFIYWAAIFSLFILVFHANRKINLLIYSLVFCSVAIDYCYKLLNGDGLTYEDVLLVTQNVGFGLETEVFKTYFPTVLSSTGLALVIVLLLVGLRSGFKNIRIQKRRYLFIPVIVFFGVNYIIYISNANRLAYPIPYKVPALLFYTSQKSLYSGKRDTVFLNPAGGPLAKHIVWIIDESVRPDMLQINNFPKETTPFLKSIQDSILNFGIASSGSVCSDYSHIMLISGLRVKELPDYKGIARKKPTIFQYANRNNMQSNLIYSPGHEDEPKGYMTHSDFDHIAHKFHTKKVFPDTEPYLLDFKSIDILEEIIGTQESSFTYLLKYGCHFHYETAYPADRRYFSPVQDISSWKRDDREKLLNSYYNAIRWEVDYFFENLYKRFEGQDVVFIYTSDHGQHLMEYPEIKLTHCIKKAAPPEMATVPLFLLPMNHRIKTELSPFFRKDNVDQASHFNIFPTTLMLMGYDPKEVHEFYGNSLFDPLQNTERIFVSGDIFGRSKVFMNTFNLKH